MIRKKKFINLVFSVTLTFTLCRNAGAELKLVSSQKNEKSDSYALAITKGGRAYWAMPEIAGDHAMVTVNPFTDTSLAHQVAVPVSDALIAVAQRSLSEQSDILIVGSDSQGSWKIVRIDGQQAKVKKSAEVKSISLATEAVITRPGYAIGGVNHQGRPVVVVLNKNLSSQKEINFSTNKAGEVSSVFVNRERLFAVTNYADASTELHELSLTGDLRSSIRLKGGVATAIPLSGSSIVVAYRVGSQLFVERLDEKFKSLWSLKLPDVRGASTIKYQLLALPGAIACVGANEGHLVVYRIGNDGNLLQTSIDKEQHFHVPPTGYYSSIAVGNEIHIRGLSLKPDIPIDGSFTSFYFIETIDAAKP
ncbi:hypothetical protein EGT07_02615 [Herbaspirillum sp. HC18]|nr:hypothetical protein EGT07_02615 [Herbaspirillum sp. HC18]